VSSDGGGGGGTKRSQQRGCQQKLQFVIQKIPLATNAVTPVLVKRRSAQPGNVPQHSRIGSSALRAFIWQRSLRPIFLLMVLLGYVVTLRRWCEPVLGSCQAVPRSEGGYASMDISASAPLLAAMTMVVIVVTRSCFI
jgi:hypothetical protein